LYWYQDLGRLVFITQGIPKESIEALFGMPSLTECEALT
jgi:hypothetical protein